MHGYCLLPRSGHSHDRRSINHLMVVGGPCYLEMVGFGMMPGFNRIKDQVDLLLEARHPGCPLALHVAMVYAFNKNKIIEFLINI